MLNVQLPILLGYGRRLQERIGATLVQQVLGGLEWIWLSIIAWAR